MEDKVIVTHRGALTRKYKAAGLSKIRGALTALVAADKVRGLKTAIIHLDDAKAMKRVRTTPVADRASPRAFKVAIDAVHKALQPDYLMILGAPDVVPHQDLDNPVFKPKDDDDPQAWGDLPYACAADYSRDPAQFVGPTRVVSRLPDLAGAREPSHIVALLKTAANWRSRPAADFTSYFGLSALVWQKSTRMSLENVFGNHKQLALSPLAGPKYPKGELRARMHFINCHGGEASPIFQGQKGEKRPVYPESLTTATTGATISDGTVAAIECCYGAQLYNSVKLGIDMPICQSYLRQGAYGYFGSTTIAYGPPDDNSAADLVCQYFLLSLLDGASVGRAALVARQQFVERTGQMDPIDLKTLAQFCVLGDPSVHPVAIPKGPAIPKGADAAKSQRFFRAERRAKLKLNGEFLEKTKPTASRKEQRRKPPAAVGRSLSRIARDAGLSAAQKFEPFAVKRPTPPKKAIDAKLATAPSRYYVAVARPRRRTKASVKRGVAVVAKEVGGQIVGFRVYHQR